MGRPLVTLSRWEKVASKPWGITGAANNLVKFTTSNDLDVTRVVRCFGINVQGTCTLGVADATAVLPENIGNIIEQIRCFGKHSVRGTTDNHIQVRGADLKTLQNLYAGVTIFDNSSVLSVDYDGGAFVLDFWIFLDFPPAGHRVEEQIGYLLDIPNWDNWELDLQFGDAWSLWNPSTTTQTWTLQTVNLFAQYAMEPKKFAGFGFGLKYLMETENATADLTTSATGKQLLKLDNNARIRSLLLKTGTKATTVTSPNNAFATLVDTILTNLQIVQIPSTKYREYGRYQDLKAIAAKVRRYNLPAGYAIIDLAEDGLSFEALDPSKLVAGKGAETALWLKGDVSGAGAQALDMVQESLYYSANIKIPTS